jgi:hypothetical protein
MTQRVDQRDHLNLQIDLVAEEEITKILQLRRAICQRLGIDTADREPECERNGGNHAAATLADELKENYRRNPRLKVCLERVAAPFSTT